MFEIECSICGVEIGDSEASLCVGEWIVCEECFFSGTVRDVLICELGDERPPLCWICSGEIDHRHSSVHVCGWVVCLRCYREYTSGRLLGDHDDYNWLMSQNREAEVFARTLRQADENWLNTQVAMLEFERGES